MEKVLEGFVEKSEWEQEKRYGVRLFTIRRFKGHETAYQRSRYGVSIKKGKNLLYHNLLAGVEVDAFLEFFFHCIFLYPSAVLEGDVDGFALLDS